MRRGDGDESSLEMVVTSAVTSAVVVIVIAVALLPLLLLLLLLLSNLGGPSIWEADGHCLCSPQPHLLRFTRARSLTKRGERHAAARRGGEQPAHLLTG